MPSTRVPGTSPEFPGYPSSDGAAREAVYRKAGMEPPWTRVYRDGRDVTHEPPETWPYPWSLDVKRSQ